MMADPNSLQAAKALQRQGVRALMDHMDPGARATASASICEQLEKSLANDTSLLLGFLPLSDEPDIRPFLQSLLDLERPVCVPMVVEEGRMEPVGLDSLDPDQLTRGLHGVLVPAGASAVPVDNIGMVLVPGVAFDQHGRRLGRGGGYYDRFLGTLSADIPTIGCCFRCQLVQHVETGPVDVPVSKMLVEEARC